jgi:hypothetical protein
MLFALLALHQADSAYNRAESLLAARDLGAARAAAEQLVTSSPNDPRAHLLLGRVWYAWPVTGRYPALAEFRRAARLAPEDPEPLDWQVRVGQHLQADDGEAIAREAILRIWALTPDYMDCWSLFAGMYHNEAIWRAPISPAPPGSRRWSDVRESRSLWKSGRVDLPSAIAPHADVAAYLLRRASPDGDATAEVRLVRLGLTHADADSTEVLWVRCG